MEDFSPRRLTIAALIGIFALIGLFLTPKLVEDVGPDEIAVIQSPIEGRLDVYATPGLKWQGFGEVTKYKKRSIYSFESIPPTVASAKPSGGIEVRFNEGGHGTIFGSIQYDLPQTEDQIRLLHSKYRSQEQVQKNLIETVTNKSIYLLEP